jgi:outer membrane protein OmpA-like peptidoglycan-associated protein
MKKPLLVFFGLMAATVLSSQNYIRNSSFEYANRAPRREGNSINRAVGWIAPKYNSDYYSKGGGFFHAGVPHNVFGHQRPHTGNSYAGICTRTHFLEYIETVLRDSLQAGQTYQIELYISRAELSIRTIKEFGILFGDKKIWGVTSRGIAIEPQIKFKQKHGFRNKHRWTKLSATYTAEGGETVLIFGHFNYNKKDDRRRVNAHYYIDDISVIAIKDSIVVEKTSIEKEPPATVTFQKADPDPAFVPELGRKMILQEVYFASNESELLPASFTELDVLTDYLSTHPKLKVQIYGHTDTTGAEAFNQTLSEDRAAAVAAYLTNKGIEVNRLHYTGFGSRKPLQSNDSEEGRKKNRRVEILISQ